MLKLLYNLTFEDLYSNDGLQQIDAIFLKYLSEEFPNIYSDLMLARTHPPLRYQESLLIMELAPLVEQFIAKLFNIEVELNELSSRNNTLTPIYFIKRNFIQRKVAKSFKLDELSSLPQALDTLKKANIVLESELEVAKSIQKALEDNNLELLQAFKIYSGWALFTIEGQEKYKHSVLFKIPKKIDNHNLLNIPHSDGQISLSDAKCINRNGFDHTDYELGIHKALDNSNYCIFCHNQRKDSCSHGLKDKASGAYITNELDIKLTGCPLEEKISEMNALRSQGSIIGALAVITIDNPMVAATGHRICNDCMKSCIYQKQEPVNIPIAETQSLEDVLSLPFGFEIYSLLTRWNPLNFRQPYPSPPTNYKVLIAGLGPAGFTLAHHLLNQGFIVVGIDGLKIEPLPTNLTNNSNSFQAIKDVKSFFTLLGDRIPGGFGGVMEYGITVRWNKNYLLLVRLLLERRQNFIAYGGIRFGGTIDYESAFQLGFDHIALALGAGKPKVPEIKNALANGVRTASDFLMSLQLSGAARYNSLANLQIRLPIVVVGGGLTAIDTATESLAYYPIQVEKCLRHYELLGDSIFENMTEQEKIIAEEFISHAKLLRENSFHKIPLLRSWGGVKIAYRKTIQDSPSYRLNHEEVIKALEEGIEFIENIVPEEILTDEYGCAKGLKHKHGILNANTILLAIGTEPNTVLAREDGEHFKLDGKYFQAIDENLQPVKPELISKPTFPQVITHINDNQKAVSFFGDLHPSFAGNVVKAMGSAKQGYPIVSKLIRQVPPNTPITQKEFFHELNTLLLARIEEVNILTPKIVELIIQAPLAAKNFQPGQFYRLQNFENTANTKLGARLATEGLALTGAWVDKEKGLLSTIILEMGGSSNLCQYFSIGEQVSLMGPTGTPTEIPYNETVLLVGGGLGNAVLLSIGKAMREQGCKVLYFAGYRDANDLYKVEEIQAASDVTVWCCDNARLDYHRASDLAFQGNLVEALVMYGKGDLGPQTIALSDVDRILVIGSDKMMKAVAHARGNILKPYFKNDHLAIGSINSPMQCMMKEICGQCLQKHLDHKTGKEYFVFSCFNQDQNLDDVDFANLNDRLMQNSMQEKICAKFIERVLE